MAQTARAAVLRDRTEGFSVEEISLPELAAGDVLVEIAGTGICHTDVLPSEGLLPGDWPVVLGHEGSGIVSAVGPGVTTVTPGDHVVLSFDSCGACSNCRSGHPAYCDTFFPRNLTAVGVGAPTAVDANGTEVPLGWFGQASFASHAIASTRNVVVVDRSLPIEVLGPFGCGFLTGAGTVTNVLDVQPGDSIVVLGLGGVGMSGLMAAVHRGASRVIAIDLHEARTSLALELGATHAVGAVPSTVLTQAILETGGPVDHVVDTTGAVSVIAAAIDALAARGTCAMVGVQREPLVLGSRALSGGKRVTAVYEGDAVPQVHVPQLIELWRSGKLPVDRLIRTYPLASIDAAFADMAAGEVIKPVLVP